MRRNRYIIFPEILFPTDRYHEHHVAVSSVRAGNVIGGGDWAEDRLIPDLVRSLQNKEPLRIRNPKSVRPWQHVLEPLYGYLMLAEKMWDDGAVYSGSWNMGPSDEDAVSVETLLGIFETALGQQLQIQADDGEHLHEAQYLKLDCSKARVQLGWTPSLTIEQCVQWVAAWTQAYMQEEDIRQFALNQIDSFEK